MSVVPLSPGHTTILTVIEQPNVRQISRLGGALLQLIERRAILHNAVALLFRVAEKIDIILAAGGRIGLGFEIAATAAHEDIDLRTKWVRVADLVLSDLLVRVAISHVSRIARRSGMIDGRCYDKTSLEAFHLSSFEDRAHGLAIIIDSNSCVNS